VYFEFINFIHQKAVDPSIFKIVESIDDDIYNLSACLSKLELFYNLRNQGGVYIQRYITTEIEYIFGVCRSLFDLFQKTAKNYWNSITLVNQSIVKKELADSFADMSLKDDFIRPRKNYRRNMVFQGYGPNFTRKKLIFS